MELMSKVKCSRGLAASVLVVICSAMGDLALAGGTGNVDKEIWYYAKGKPILVIDKKTGKRLPVETVEDGKTPRVEDAVPTMLQRYKSNDSGNVIRWSPRRRYYSRNRYRDDYLYGYGYGYGYLGYRVIPRFSRTGYYGPARYVPYYGYGYGCYRPGVRFSAGFSGRRGRWSFSGVIRR